MLNVRPWARRLEQRDLVYVGACRLPRRDELSFDSGRIAFHRTRNGGTLFLGTRGNLVGEMTIPELRTSNDVTQLDHGSIVQEFRDPFDDRIGDVGDLGGVNLAGLHVYQECLYASALIYYDANDVQRIAVGRRSPDLSINDFSGFAAVWRPWRSGYVAGYMATVPPEWVDALQGPAVIGQFGIPIVSRTSNGPAAFAFDPAMIGHVDTVPASPLVYYDMDHATLGPWDGSNPVYGGTSTGAGVVLIPGTSTALFFGANGVGPFSYGIGLSDPDDPRIGQPIPGASNETYSYDPASSDKGQHAFPYRFQVWAYDLNDWADVAADRRNPWDVVPYAVWPIELPIVHPTMRLGGVTFDPDTATIYLSQIRADVDGYSSRSIIHAFRIAGLVPPPIAVPPQDPPPVNPPAGNVPSPDVNGGRAADASMLDYYAAAALQANVGATPAQLFDKAAAMIAERNRRKGPA